MRFIAEYMLVLAAGWVAAAPTQPADIEIFVCESCAHGAEAEEFFATPPAIHPGFEAVILLTVLICVLASAVLRKFA